MKRNRPQRNNNPLNIRYVKQPEATGPDKDGYAIFPTPEAGWRAAHAQIRLDANRGLTLREFVYKFAPSSENDTIAYLDFIESSIVAGPHMLLNDISPYAIAGVMAQMEGYYAIDKPK